MWRMGFLKKKKMEEEKGKTGRKWEGKKGRLCCRSTADFRESPSLLK